MPCKCYPHPNYLFYFHKIQISLDKILNHSCKKSVLTDEGHKTISIRFVTELLHQGLGLILGQLLSKVGQQAEQLVGQHSVVLVFVIELKDLNEVVKASLVLGVLAGLVHGEHIGLGEGLLALLGGASNLLNGLDGGV